MITSFHDAATADVFNGIKSKAVRKAFPDEVVKIIKRKLDTLHAATKPEDLLSAGNRLEHLTTSRPGYYSMRVNNRFRLTFRFESGRAIDVACEDYHPG